MSVQLDGESVKITSDNKVQLTRFDEDGLPSYSLVCASIFGSAGKQECGFSDPDNPGTLFRIQTHTESSSAWFIPDPPDPDNPPCTVNCSGYCKTTYNSDCSTTESGSRSVEGCGLSGSGSLCGSTCIGVFAGCRYDPGDGSYCCPNPEDGGGSSTHGSECGSYSTYYDDEITTESTIGDAAANLPGYPTCCGDDDCELEDGQSCSCQAFLNISEDETSVALGSFIYKFVTDSPPPAGAVLLWVERFGPDDMSGEVDNMRSFTWDGSLTETGVFTCNYPSSNGAITVDEIHWQ